MTLRPLIFISASFLQRFDGFALFLVVIFLINKIFKKFTNWRIFNVVSTFLGSISSYEVGFLPGINSKFSPKNSIKKAVRYFLGVDDLYAMVDNSFKIYQGSFSSNSFIYSKAHLLLPISVFSERISTYLNLEGRLRKTKKAIAAFKSVILDFEVSGALFLLYKRSLFSNFSVLPLFYTILNFFNNIITYGSVFMFSLFDLSARLFLVSGFHLVRILQFNVNLFYPYFVNLINCSIHSFCFLNSIFSRAINNYYANNIYCLNSRTLATCASKFRENCFPNII